MARQKKGSMKRVYLNEYNIRMEKSAYLPIATGLLRAFAETAADVRDNYTFAPFNYHMDSLVNIMSGYDAPDVAAFSVSMWNEQLNLAVAAEVKRRWPYCLIVMGGPQVPQHPQEYFKRYPFLDVAVRAEGEEAFTKILLRNLESRNFDGLTGVSYRKDGECIRNTVESHQPKDLDMYPSPYLEGLFDGVMQDAERRGMGMQAIIETNRGCPFPCSFCYWGQGGLSRKYRFHGVERVKQEIEWAARNKIRYLFNADSNFGMHKRDEEIAQILVDVKREYGFPEKFRTCFGKNADERIYEIAKKLHGADLEKGITLALQSNNKEVLKNIQRQNIKLETYKNLQVKFNDAHVPVYSELILGMPGETLETWKEGIEAMLSAGLKNQLFIYLCQIFPNTEMADPEYQKRFGIVTQRIELNEIHGAIRTPDLTTEYEDVIVTTNAMPLVMWRDMVLFSWLTMVMHSLKVMFFVTLYLAHRHKKPFTDFIAFMMKYGDRFPHIASELREFNSQIDRLLAGQGRGRKVEGYAPIYWDEEEASFLRIAEQVDPFYEEMLDLTRSYLECNDIAHDEAELREVITYQRLRIPTAQDEALRVHVFNQNVPEYFDRLLTSIPVELRESMQTMTIHSRQFPDKGRFAVETLMWGRKSGTIMTKVEWKELERIAA
jgi:putative methyltransferase